MNASDILVVGGEAVENAVAPMMMMMMMGTSEPGTVSNQAGGGDDVGGDAGDAGAGAAAASLWMGSAGSIPTVVLIAAFVIGVLLGTVGTRLRQWLQAARGVETPERRRRWEQFVRQLSDSRVLPEDAILDQVRQADLPILGGFGASMGCTSSTVLHEIARCPHASTQLLTSIVEEALRQNPGRTPQEVVNWTNGKGATPLHECCFAGNFENIVWLVQHGADVNAKTRAGRTVLHEVLSSSRSADAVDIIQYLLCRGASLAACDRMALPVLGSAVYRAPDDVVAVLLKHADADDIKLTTPSGESLLHLAISEGRKGLVKLLVGAGADVNAVDSRGVSVFEAACCAAQPDMAAFLLWKGSRLNSASDTLFRRCVARGRKYVRIGWTNMPVGTDVVEQRNAVFALMAALGVPVSLNCLVFEKSLMSYPCSTLYLILSLGAFGATEDDKLAKHFGSLEATAAAEIAGATFSRLQVADMWARFDDNTWQEAAASSGTMETRCAWLLLNMIRQHRPRTTATQSVPTLQNLCRNVYRKQVLSRLSARRPQNEAVEECSDRASPRTIRRTIRSHMSSRSSSPQRARRMLRPHPIAPVPTRAAGTGADGMQPATAVAAPTAAARASARAATAPASASLRSAPASAIFSPLRQRTFDWGDDDDGDEDNDRDNHDDAAAAAAEDTNTDTAASSTSAVIATTISADTGLRRRRRRRRGQGSTAARDQQGSSSSRVGDDDGDDDNDDNDDQDATRGLWTRGLAVRFQDLLSNVGWSDRRARDQVNEARRGEEAGRVMMAQHRRTRSVGDADDIVRLDHNGIILRSPFASRRRHNNDDGVDDVNGHGNQVNDDDNSTRHQSASWWPMRSAAAAAVARAGRHHGHHRQGRQRGQRHRCRGKHTSSGNTHRSMFHWRGWYSTGTSPHVLSDNEDERDAEETLGRASDGEDNDAEGASDADVDEMHDESEPAPLEPGLNQQLLSAAGDVLALDRRNGNLYTAVQRLPVAFRGLMMYDDAQLAWPLFADMALDVVVAQRAAATTH
ncbi:hypothetical protein PTSG_07565 [Salpingoeca rosetta]|uniref:Uncharacterized protein n=1 Tax=Salpingoeca rosetta (strain ATCC 50818 / BSB-021) TaxID=946362 RepID=F2UH47_SALR5|nr:uncharacterized protein PTSG_07565 [Salpingoeca rosetta]EGD76446.1 hypothetical protein PTSG_07565 [Salpingoeca rosetta]|eukprot:XP_004991361.1 hypothetical protein PTSG_07565 [Salpingoeca rosetta]